MNMLTRLRHFLTRSQPAPEPWANALADSINNHGEVDVWPYAVRVGSVSRRLYGANRKLINQACSRFVTMRLEQEQVSFEEQLGQALAKSPDQTQSMPSIGPIRTIAEGQLR